MFGFFVMCGLTTTVPAERPAPDGPRDAALIAAAQRGDVAAFGALHARHYKRIYHLAYLKTNNAQDAEDVASETFMRALASLGRFRLKRDPEGGPVSFYPWLHRIALNLIVDGHRQRPPSGVVSLDAPVIAGMRALLDSQLPDGCTCPRRRSSSAMRCSSSSAPPSPPCRRTRATCSSTASWATCRRARSPRSWAAPSPPSSPCSTGRPSP